MKRRWSVFIETTTSERRGLVLLLILIIISILIPWWFNTFRTDIPDEFIVYNSSQSDSSSYNNQRQGDIKEKDIELFYFDPNTLGAEGFMRLGLSEKLSQTIINYRTKGGRFRQVEDLRKIYGLSDQLFLRIKPFALIRSKDKGVTKEVFSSKSRVKTVYRAIELNKADTADLITLPGIGSYWAARVLRYRNILGGFYRLEQVQEIYGFPKETYESLLSRNLLLLDTTSCTQIAINEVNIKELVRHPYVGYQQAKLLLNYRDAHGAFLNHDDLQKVLEVDKEMLKRLSPYLRFN